MAAGVILALAFMPASAEQDQPSAPKPALTADEHRPPANTSQQNAPRPPNETNPLNLTEVQKDKLRPLILEERLQLDMVRSDNSLAQEQKIRKANDIRTGVATKIKAILTPEQFQKLLELDQQRNGSSPNPGSPPATSDNPQK
jgi:Spy/CpxP family protein refolding chaperone